MNTNTPHDTRPAPPFEDRLLSAILDDYTAFTAAPVREVAARRHPRRAAGFWAVPVAVATAAVAVILISGGSGDRSAAPPRSPRPAIASVKHTTLYKLAGASVAAPAVQGRYVVLGETDTSSGQAGESKRTTVIDAQTGSSVTYQQPYAGSSAPAELTEGAQATNTEAWFAALPTDPAALRARLLTIAEAQQQQANAMNAKKQALSAPGSTTGTRQATEPQPSSDDLVYEEANDLLWNPLTPPAVRAALYKVLAATSGFTVDQHATDPDGRPAIAMTRSTTISGTAETDITYESPSTGAVLAQVWKTGSDTSTAVYEPTTGSGTMPPNPYTAR